MGEKITKYDSDATARKNLTSILEEESRLLYPHEVAWLLATSLTSVYEVVPRAKTIDSSVRFDPKTVKLLKNQGLSVDHDTSGSLKIEKKNTLVLSNKRKVKIDI